MGNQIDPSILRNRAHKTVGPWPCDKCGKLSAYADVRPDENRVYCLNESCRYARTIDKRRSRILEDDGTVWAFNDQGEKWRVRA